MHRLRLMSHDLQPTSGARRGSTTSEGHAAPFSGMTSTDQQGQDVGVAPFLSPGRLHRGIGIGVAPEVAEADFSDAVCERGFSAESKTGTFVASGSGSMRASTRFEASVARVAASWK
jgi:hypothetical protein